MSYTFSFLSRQKKNKITRLKSTPNPEALKGTHVPPTGLRAALGLLVSDPLTLLSSAPGAAQGLCEPGFPHPHKAPQYAHTHPPFLSPFPSLPVAHVLPRRSPTTTCSELSFRGKLVTQDHCQNHAGHLMGQVPRSPSRTALLLQRSNHVNKERSEHTLAQAEDSLYFGLLGTTYPSGFQAEPGCREV